MASELAWSIHTGLAEAGFDLALSYSLTLDHGVVQSYEMRGCLGIPLVPIVVNTAAPPLPSLEHCVQPGTTLGAVLRGAEVPARVLLVASGGLSHWLASNDPARPEGHRRETRVH